MWVCETTNIISREECNGHRKQFSPHKMGMQVSHSFCAKIQKAGNLKTDQSRCRTDSGNTMQKKRNWDHRGRSLPGSHTYACKNTTKIFCIRNHGIFEREKFSHDLWEACELKVQIWKSSLLVQRILCRHGRKEYSCNQEIYPKPAQRGLGVWPDVISRVYWPVYGWAGEEKQKIKATWSGSRKSKQTSKPLMGLRRRKEALNEPLQGQLSMWCSWQTLSAPSGRKQEPTPYRGGAGHRLSRWSWLYEESSHDQSKSWIVCYVKRQMDSHRS